MPKITNSREEFERIHAQPKWARSRKDLEAVRALRAKRLVDAKRRKRGTLPVEATSESDGEEVQELLRDASAPLAREGGQALPAEVIQVGRLRDANESTRHASVVASLAWHVGGDVLASGGRDGTVRLVHVDGRANPVLQEVALPDVPVQRVLFAAGGRELFAAGRRPFFDALSLESGQLSRFTRLLGASAPTRSFENVFAPDGAEVDVLVVAGRDGRLSVVDARTKQLRCELKLPGPVFSDACFSPDGAILAVAGGTSRRHVTLYDWAAERCLGAFPDEGSLHTTCIRWSPCGQWLATGQKSGVVNIYAAPDRATLAAGSLPALFSRPAHVVMNLTTEISALAWHPCSQLLAVASNRKKDALRLVHMPSGTVFRNWPTVSTPLSHVSTVAFSPGGRLLAIGNDKGKVLLYQLHHYSSDSG